MVFTRVGASDVAMLMQNTRRYIFKFMRTLVHKLGSVNRDERCDPQTGLSTLLLVEVHPCRKRGICPVQGF
jgi:hypothetical protein